MSDAPNVTPASMVARRLTADDKGAAGFLKWMKVSMPAMYRDLLPDIKRLQLAAKSASPEGLGAFGEAGNTFEVPASSANASSSWADSLSKLVGAWGQYKLTDAQLDLAKQITQTNLSRAQQGLAPLPYDAAQLGLAPTVNFGLSGSTSKLVMYGGIAAGLLFFLPKLLRQR